MGLNEGIQVLDKCYARNSQLFNYSCCFLPVKSIQTYLHIDMQIKEKKTFLLHILGVHHQWLAFRLYMLPLFNESYENLH